MVIVLSLFAFVLISLVGLHLVALSAGTAAETSSIAANLARARMEALLALPREQLMAQNNAEQRIQFPPGGRPYSVRTTVVPSDPARLDLTVTVTWQLAYGGACASAGAGADCAGTQVSYSRTLQTRVQALEQASAQP